MNFIREYQAIIKKVGLVFASAGAIFCSTAITLKFNTITSAPTAAFCFLTIVLLSAFFGDLLVAIVTSIVATLCFDYFYLPPLGTLHISAFSDWIALAAFLLTSVIISRLTASAAENKAKAKVLNKTLVQLKEFGERLLSISPDQQTLSGIAKEALNIFSLEYCSIHVYGEGKWQHFTGSAANDISAVIENRLAPLKDHTTDLMELADENLLGVRYQQITMGKTMLALLAVKSKTLPADAIGTIAYFACSGMLM